ncbi:hypothetical protein GCM10009623_17500 [Nocardioides aestuarii]|uniref:Fluoride ion transporter CrcB n=1 Tax=Nocardioides aestuarii TaxID=252231 RepID=A0ABW4TKH3_9ACTN
MTLRTTAAVAVVVSAAVHFWMWLDFAREDDVLGPSFLLNAVGGAVIAVLVLTWRHWLAGALAAGFGLSTLGAFVPATTVGFLGVEATWDGWEVWVAAASEVVAAVAGALLVAPLLSHRQSQHHPAVGDPHLH